MFPGICRRHVAGRIVAVCDSPGADVTDSARSQLRSRRAWRRLSHRLILAPTEEGLPAGNWFRWLYERPSTVSFRTARPSHYIRLFAIRFLIVLGAGFALYGQFVSFHIEVPLMQTLALTPFIMAIGNSPFPPGGIGTTQLVFTMAFARFVGKNDLFALSMAVTTFSLLARIPMGLAMGAQLVEEAVEVKSEFLTKTQGGVA
jgi:uncharacterized membrane protein YbhN (UPF0104 family)